MRNNKRKWRNVGTGLDKGDPFYSNVFTPLRKRMEKNLSNIFDQTIINKSYKIEVEVFEMLDAIQLLMGRVLNVE